MMIFVVAVLHVGEHSEFLQHIRSPSMVLRSWVLSRLDKYYNLEEILMHRLSMFSDLSVINDKSYFVGFSQID